MPLRLRNVLSGLPNTIPLAVRTQRTTYLPGETVEIVVSAGPAERDLEVDGLVVTLENAVRYTYNVNAGRYARTTHRTDRETAAEQRIALQGAIAVGEAPEIRLSLAVPESSFYPGTGGGQIVVSRWTVKVLLGIPKSVDATAECEIQVGTPRELHEGRTTHDVMIGAADHETRTFRLMAKAAAHAKQDETLDIDVRVDEPNVALGGRITGTIALQPRERLEPEGIRVELKRHEEVRLGEGMTAITHASVQELASDRALVPGETTELPFELEVPPDAPATLIAPNGSVVWLVSAIVDRKRRNDFTVGREVNVYSGAGLEAGPRSD